MMGISLYIKLCNFITTHLYIPISIYIYITTHLYIPYLTYCNIVWSSTYVTMQPKNNSSFTKTSCSLRLRILTNSEYRTHSDSQNIGYI
jgi:hypothetical protein